MRSWTLKHWVGAFILLAGMMAMTYFFATQEVALGLMIAIIPLSVLIVLISLKQPYWALMLLFVENYFLMGISRYVPVSSLGILTDLLFAFILFSTLFRSVINGDIEWRRALNGGTILLTIWLLYCVLELANPTAVTAAWATSIRSLTLYPLLTIILASIHFRRFEDMSRIITLWAAFTLIAIIKLQMQKTLGFDAAENRWLMQGENMKTHLLATGTRYFSIFTDAGNFGSNMGCAAVVFFIAGLYAPNKLLRGFLIITSILGLYALIISGTRGALAVPLAGFVLFTLMTKKGPLIVLMLVLLLSTFVFFRYTTIGQSNQYIRRMRTAFNLNEPSLVVRLENQKRLGSYIKTRPFGEGVGLSGVAAKRYAPNRLTTNIPNDSWYVKVWVETGIVGLLLYLSIQFAFLGYGIWLVMKNLKHRQLKGYLTAMLCGMFGMMASSYGNAIWGQYPTWMLMALTQAFVMMAPRYDDALERLT
jgi:hypothetical protein